MGKVSQLYSDLQRAEGFRPTNAQIYAVSKLVGYLEGQITEGGFKPQTELEIRIRVAETIAAFGLQHHEAALESNLVLIREAIGEQP